jgi:hypothetical protein
MANPSAPRQTREQMIIALEAGEYLNVDGYFWSKNYWTDAQRHTLILPSEAEQRPWHVVHVTNQTSSTKKGNFQDREEHVGIHPFWEIPLRFPPESNDLSDVSLKWIESSVLCGKSPA